MGAVSGAHLNPASVAFALLRDFPCRRVPAASSSRSSARLPRSSCCSPCSATSSTSVRRLRFRRCKLADAGAGDRAHHRSGQRHLRQRLSRPDRRRDRRDRRRRLHRARRVVAAPVIGVSINPARAFGPALISGDFTRYLLYVVGPSPRRRSLSPSPISFQTPRRPALPCRRVLGANPRCLGRSRASQRTSNTPLKPPGIADNDEQALER